MLLHSLDIAPAMPDDLKHLVRVLAAQVAGHLRAAFRIFRADGVDIVAPILIGARAIDELLLVSSVSSPAAVSFWVLAFFGSPRSASPTCLRFWSLRLSGSGLSTVSAFLGRAMASVSERESTKETLYRPVKRERDCVR